MNTACEGSIPIDAFINALPRRSSTCVGVCSLADCSWADCTVADCSWADCTWAAERNALLLQIARTWSLQTLRSSCIVTGQQCSAPSDFHPSSQPEWVCWSWLTQPDSVSTLFNSNLARDVAGMSKLRSEHGLILLELGPVDSPTAQVVSRLCDGLVMLVDSQSSQPGNKQVHQKLIARIEALVRPDCRWLGYWSLGSALQAA